METPQSLSEGLLDELKRLEQLLLTDAVRKNREAVSALLAEDFREFGSSGRIFTKNAILDLLETEGPGQVSMEDFALQEITSSVALVTYKSISLAGPSVRKALRSSLWKREEGSWRMVFHQGTLTAAFS